MAPGAAEAGLLGHGFTAGVDRPRAAERLLLPFRQQAPEGQPCAQLAMLLALEEDRLARPICSLGA